MMKLSVDNHQGFTLIELLVVLLLTAILAGTGRWMWRDIRQRLQLAETATQLQFFLTGVREYANSRNRDLSLHVISIGNGWCVDARSDAATPACSGQGRLVWQAPYTAIELRSVSGAPGFFGRRNLARGGSIEFGSAQHTWRVVISSRARVRICQSSQEAC